MLRAMIGMIGGLSVMVCAAAAFGEGACCLQEVNGHWFCVETSADHCEVEGGVWHGDDTACNSEACPDDMLGACCMMGACVPSGQASCESFFGN